jgi:hypothetical protein
MSGLEPVALPRFYAQRRDREWFVIDRDGEREPPAPMRHGMAQARDVARMLNAELEKPHPPVERDPRRFGMPCRAPLFVSRFTRRLGSTRG